MAGGFVHGVFEVVLDDFVVDNRKGIEVVFGGQEKGVGQDIGQFFAESLRINILRLAVVLPQKQFVEFGGFDGEGQGQIPGIVKGGPLSLIPEGKESGEGVLVGRGHFEGIDK